MPEQPRTGAHGGQQVSKLPRRGYLLGSMALLLASSACLAGFLFLLLRPQVDPGVRVWLLNHAPDQVVVIDPNTGTTEASFQVSDGLRGITFSRDGKQAYIFGVVDVTNKLTVLNTRTYLKEDILELDGVPQGIATFPENNLVAMIMGSRTDFMSGGFDVIDLDQRSKANPNRRVNVNLMRERGLQLSHKIAVADDGDRIYMIDAKDSKLFVYSFKQRRKLKEVELAGAAEGFLYPRQGDYYFVSVLKHFTIYQIRKDTDEIVAGYVFSDMDPRRPFLRFWLRQMALDPTGRYLYSTCNEQLGVAIWDLNNPEYVINPANWSGDPSGEGYPRLKEFPCYLPITRFAIPGHGAKDGYIPNPSLIASDPLNESIFVVDEDGGLYIYDRRDVQKYEPPSYLSPDRNNLPRPKPRNIVLSLANDTTEIRDIVVSSPRLPVKVQRDSGGGSS